MKRINELNTEIKADLNKLNGFNLINTIDEKDINETTRRALKDLNNAYFVRLFDDIANKITERNNLVKIENAKAKKSTNNSIKAGSIFTAYETFIEVIRATDKNVFYAEIKSEVVKSELEIEEIIKPLNGAYFGELKQMKLEHFTNRFTAYDKNREYRQISPYVF